MNYSFEKHLKNWRKYKKIVKEFDQLNEHRKQACDILDALNMVMNSTLNENEKNILFDFYYTGLKVDDICLKYNYSRSQYYRIRKNALTKMETYADVLPE